jgi:hypothetical protein
MSSPEHSTLGLSIGPRKQSGQHQKMFPGDLTQGKVTRTATTSSAFSPFGMHLPDLHGQLREWGH